MIKIIGYYITSVGLSFTGSQVQRYLVSKVFKRTNSKKEIKSDLTEENKIKKRKSAVFYACEWFLCFGDKRAKQNFDHSCDIISNQFDIAYFLKHQLIGKLHRQLAFTKTERFLLKNQVKPFVLDDRGKGGTSDNSSDYDGGKLIDKESIYFKQLLQGALY